MGRTFRSLLFGFRNRNQKTTFVADQDRNAAFVSPEDLMLRGQNNWLGWKCSAGVENIFVDAEGDYYVAACRAGGVLGNVFNTGNKPRIKTGKENAPIIISLVLRKLRIQLQSVPQTRDNTI